MFIKFQAEETMKKLLAILLIVCTLFSFCACDIIEGYLGGSDLGGGLNVDDLFTDDNKKPDDHESVEKDELPENKKTYNDFTMSEKALFTRYIGALIPFIPNNEYYIEGYYDTDDYEHGMNFYTIGNTEAEFLSYLELYSDYELYESYEDDYGDTWYCYKKDDIVVDLSYYLYEGKYYVDVFVYSSLSTDIEDDDTEQTSKIDEWRETYSCITISEALDMCENYVNSPSSTRYYIIATVTEVQDTTYGQLMIEDETGEIMVYGTRSADGTDRYDAMGIDLEVGDVILIYGTLQYFKSYLYEVQNAWLIDYYTENNASSGSGSDSGSTTHYYNSFTSSETALFKEYFGLVIPFLPNDSYYVEEYTYDYEDDGVTEVGINFYTYGNTKAEYNSYRNLLSYTLYESYVDDYGDTWYSYDINDTVMLDISYYETSDGSYVVDVYVYKYEDIGASGGNSGNTGGGVDKNYELITNDGKGLPDSSDGVHKISFTKAKNVKDVTDQGYYLDGCPTVGSPAVLVIPVEFSDQLASTKGYTTSALKNAFMKNGVCDYYSVYDYYYISSYGQLTLDITVLDSWFKPQYSSSYYYNATDYYYGEEVAIGDQLILDEALAYLSKTMDLSKFDSDGNDIIDAVILVNTLDIGEEEFYWAYRYWNTYTDDDGYFYEYDGVSANDYVWASYQFLFEKTDKNGDSTYDDKSVMNTYTYIHEFAHILGVDDYYDTTYETDPMNGLDIMDAMMGDHNAYTKFNLGWITTSRLVVTKSTVTLTLEAFSLHGDTIILATNWDDELGVYQEYFVIMYYTDTGLNADDAGYFTRDGVVVYHINASLYKEIYDGKTYYDVYNNNTSPSDSSGTENNLIEYVKSSSDTYTYAEGDTLPTVTDDSGNTLAYTFVVDEITSDYATITFSVAK